ncbi:unnamed protein product [Cyclocybe aegerita]|uniref:Lysosomal dipeptide transporter MFSD1 n=1 Tax=Cyclocybe aegerita TaxID=1973307 RepID=A0A8S0WE17_CYCAE|nr:unnamed protein product [Cyclocybe aegerita]
MEDYRRSTCDHLLETATSDAESEIDQPAVSDGLLGKGQDEADEEEDVYQAALQRDKQMRRRAFFVRTVALLCACCLSVGGHYASNILGPLKSRIQRELGATHTEYGLLLSAYSLNSTWTPLVGGVLASRLGTTITSILATGVILLGQIFLLLGDIWGNIRLMALGLFTFGLGISPLAVVQETIIVRFFKSHGLGVSMAFGLIAGKGASFVAARTTYPLTEHFGTRAPFFVATSLAALSVLINLLYISLSRWLIDGAGAELEVPDISDEARRRQSVSISEAQALEKVAEKRKVHLRQVTKLGDVFWAYVALNLFCGTIWAPFIHLAANLIQKRYNMSEEVAAYNASYLLAGPLLLYPLCGYLVDKKKQQPIVIQLLLLSSTLTLLGYIWFALPASWTSTPLPGIFSYAFGHGFAPLLLVVIVPKIVPLKYISTALGVHKSIEQTGSTLFQTLAGVVLDSKKKEGHQATRTAFQYLLNALVVLNVLQFATILILAYLQRQKDLAYLKTHSLLATSVSALDDSSTTSSPRHSRRFIDQETPLLAHTRSSQYLSVDAGSSFIRPRSPRPSTRNKAEMKRGQFLAMFCACLTFTAWILFMTTAWFKLGGKKDGH